MDMFTLCCHAESWIRILPSIWWGLIVLIALIVAICAAKSILIKHIESREKVLKEQNTHEADTKAIAFEREKYWHESKEKDLDRRIREYEQLTKVVKEDESAQKFKEFKNMTLGLLDRAASKQTVEDVQKLNASLTGISQKIDTLANEINEFIANNNQ